MKGRRRAGVEARPNCGIPQRGAQRRLIVARLAAALGVIRSRRSFEQPSSSSTERRSSSMSQCVLGGLTFLLRQLTR